MIRAILLSALSLGLAEDAARYEAAGDLASAGALYEQAGDLQGIARVLCSLVEEALYAGHANRALWLIQELSATSGDDELTDYWYARLAWCCGLDSMARAGLDSVDGEAWIVHRARGTSLLYAGDTGGAVREFAISLGSGTTARRRFYSALDLGFALLADGRTDEASSVAGFLRGAFPSEGLPAVLQAITLWRSGYPSRAAALLDSLRSCGTLSPVVRDMATRTLEEIE